MKLSPSLPTFLKFQATRLAIAALFFVGSHANGEIIDIFLIGGQSNADGRANISGSTQNLPAVLRNPQNDVPVYWGSSNSSPAGGKYPFRNPGALTVLQPGLTRDAPNLLGPEVSFGRSMADYYAREGGTIALIKYAVGGTSLAVDWKAGGTASELNDGGSYQNFQSIVIKGMTAIQAAHPDATLRISGMIWMQGEEDTSDQFSAAYQKNLADFISDIRLTYGENLPFVIGQLSINQTRLSALPLASVRNAQAAVAAADPYSRLVVTDSFGLNSDHLHFNRPGQVDLGYAFASKMQEMVAVPEPSQTSMVLLGISFALGCGLIDRGRGAPAGPGRIPRRATPRRPARARRSPAWQSAPDRHPQPRLPLRWRKKPRGQT